MVTWILTTGNSDVQLKTENNWLYVITPILDMLPSEWEPTPSDNTEEDIWTVPARVLGLTYQNHLEDYYEDLAFPLLSNFSQKLLEEKATIPDTIIYLLTDQESIFPDYSMSRKSPCWKDTCTLQPILERYFQETFPKAKQITLFLKPTENGLDHWDSTLRLIQNSLRDLDISKNETIYVSHQAGTPAISSALQFVSLSKFGKKVKFLVGNEYKQGEAEIIDSSRYLRGIQIEQAKGLIPTSPGAAKKIVDELEGIETETINELEKLVDFFNLKRSLDEDEDEFAIEPATRRIVDVLDLIGIFFNQENYLQGITLLSAAQETFMKVAILQEVSQKTINLNGEVLKGSEALSWTNDGLLLSSKVRGESISKQQTILQQLGFIINKLPKNPNNLYKETNKNSRMIKCLKTLNPEFQPWQVLEWSCDYFKERENDLRNQLVHNLRGMNKNEVINYLLGYKRHDIEDVMEAYNNEVKQPFFEALRLFNLPYKRDKLRKKQQNIAEALS